jgi:hypothetical protein
MQYRNLSWHILWIYNDHPYFIYDAYKAIIRQQVELKIKRRGKILMSGFNSVC